MSMDASYGGRADVPALRTRDGGQKHVTDSAEIFKKIKIEENDNFDALNRLSRFMPPRRMQPWPYITAEYYHDG